MISSNKHSIRAIWQHLHHHHHHHSILSALSASIWTSASRNGTIQQWNRSHKPYQSPVASPHPVCRLSTDSSIHLNRSKGEANQTPSTAASLPVAAVAAQPSSHSLNAHPGFLMSTERVFLSDGSQAVINDLFKDKKVLLLGYVAAFSRLCRQSLLSYSGKANELKKKLGIDHIYAISVNDHSVISAFLSSLSLHHQSQITFIADFDCRVTRWLGMEIDLSSIGFGWRSQRYAMLVDHQQITVVRVESDVATLDVSSVESMIKVLTQMKKEKEEQKQKQEGEKKQLQDEAENRVAAIVISESNPDDEAKEAQKIPPLIQ